MSRTQPSTGWNAAPKGTNPTIVTLLALSLALECHVRDLWVGRGDWLQAAVSQVPETERARLVAAMRTRIATARAEVPDAAD